MAKQRVTLPSGVVVEGEGDDFRKTLLALGFEGDSKEWYNSATKGPMLISDMNWKHLQNAICKLYRDWVADLNTKPILEFLKLLRSGPSNETVLAMVEELGKRKVSGKLKNAK